MQGQATATVGTRAATKETWLPRTGPVGAPPLTFTRCMGSAKPARPRRPPSAPRSSWQGSGAVLLFLVAVVVAGCGVLVNSWAEESKPPPAKRHAKARRGPATPLHFAAQKGELETAKRLVLGGASVDAETKLGATPLHVACEQGQLELARLLLELGAAHSAQTDAGLSPLHFAAERGAADVAQLLLASGANAGAHTNTGHTPLHIATQKAELEAMSVLLSHGGAIDSRTSLGHTPLHLAALMGEAQALRLLLANGADADSRNAHSGHTPLHVAAQKGQQHVAELLLTLGGAQVDAKTHMGHTPLHIALEEGHDEHAHMLLHHGASPSFNDHRGITPMHIAAGRGAAGMIRELVRRGAAANALTSFGLSPLDVAVYRAPTAAGAPIAGGTLSADGSPSSDEKVMALLDPLAAVEALLQAGVMVTAAHPWTGQTPVHAAAYLGREAWSGLMLSQAPAGIDDARRHIQRGDGLEQRAQSTGRMAPSSVARLARLRHAAADAYSAAILLEPTSATAYARLATVQARLADSLGDETRTASLQAFEHMWRLQPNGWTDMTALARHKTDMALAGVSVQEEAQRPAQTVAELSVIDISAPGAARRAVSLWRRQGVVVFPALLESAAVQALRARADTQRVASVDRTAHIRAPANRTLRAVPVTHSTEALSTLASQLDSFLAEALQSHSRLLLEVGLMRALPGAADQGWHRDDGVLDGRVASVQIALVDTAAAQGALEVLPASHTHTEATEDTSGGVALAVPAGSVTVYSPNVVHRGRANTHGEERLTQVLTLMGASGLVPNGIPLVIEREDAGRWWLEAGELRAK